MQNLSAIYCTNSSLISYVKYGKENSGFFYENCCREIMTAFWKRETTKMLT